MNIIIFSRDRDRDPLSGPSMDGMDDMMDFHKTKLDTGTYTDPATNETVLVVDDHEYWSDRILKVLFSNKF